MLWSLSLSPPCQLPITLGDRERESRMITFSISIFWAYETVIFCKIWIFTEAALLSGTPVRAKNLANLLNWKYSVANELGKHLSCRSQVTTCFIFKWTKIQQTEQNYGGDIICTAVRGKDFTSSGYYQCGVSLLSPSVVHFFFQSKEKVFLLPFKSRGKFSKLQRKHRLIGLNPPQDSGYLALLLTVPGNI